MPHSSDAWGPPNPGLPHPGPTRRLDIRVFSTNYKVQAKERNIYKEAGHYSAGTWNLKENPPCNAENNVCAGLVIIEAWFGGY